MDIWLTALTLTALLIGWIWGRFFSAKPKPSSAQDLSNCSESYIQGLNYLLANKSDKAIELFVDLIKVDKETMETHLALGNLFRSKGEVDKAITIHQNLIARPNLDQSQRGMALTELAEDYLKAGLLDRAENLFKELVQINPKNPYAQRRLLEIYSLEKSWREARDAAQMLFDLGEADSRLILTHCYCEMAEQNIAEGNLREAREHLAKAIQIDDKCVRAYLALIELHLKNNELSKATRLLNQLLRNSPQYIDLYLKPARDIYLTSGSTAQYQKFLAEQYDKTPASSVALELLESYLKSDQHELLLALLHRALKLSTSLELLEFAFHYFKNRPQQMEKVWPDLSLQFEKMKHRRDAYMCSICGYASQAMHWNCPSCKSWSSIKPVLAE